MRVWNFDAMTVTAPDRTALAFDIADPPADPQEEVNHTAGPPQYLNPFFLLSGISLRPSIVATIHNGHRFFPH